MSDQDEDKPGALARTGWRGDEHRLQVMAAQEAGLPSGQVAVDLYTEGFKHGIIERDPADGAIVLRGRTLLKSEELERSLRPMFQFLRIAADAVRTRVHDGQFEVRVAAQVAEASAPVQGAARSVLFMWLAGGLLGWWMLSVSRVTTFLVWGITLMLGAWSLRRGLVSGRTMLAARMAVGLALLAHEEQLILPPGGGSSGGQV
jgi:hypothetical protein